MVSQYLENYKTQYTANDLNGCVTALLQLALHYELEMIQGKKYNHNLKNIMLECDAIKNPTGFRYTEEDYHKSLQILTATVSLMNDVETGESKLPGLVPGKFKFNAAIWEDILQLYNYTKCFYKINEDNSKCIDECKITQMGFTEQILLLISFIEDQVRSLKHNFPQIINQSGCTGLELRVSTYPVENNQGVSASIGDTLESNMESVNAYLHYLYYKEKKSITNRTSYNDWHKISVGPYENYGFVKVMECARARSIFCLLEEEMRYGYRLAKKFTNPDNENGYMFCFQNDDKNLARYLGITRREAQYQANLLYLTQNNTITKISYISVAKLSVILSNLQEKSNDGFIDFEMFHPDEVIFQSAEISSLEKVSVCESAVPEEYISCVANGIKIKDLLLTYSYLETLSKIFYECTLNNDKEKSLRQLYNQLALISIDYLTKELARIHCFKEDYACKLVNCFIFHHKHNTEEDLFAQPLVTISKTQIILSPALLNQVNLERVIVRQLSRHNIDISCVGHSFENKFINVLSRGFRPSYNDREYRSIPNFSVNKNKVEFCAYDGKDVEFDCICVLNDYLILTELKALMTSYDVSDLEKRRKMIKFAVEQLQRRKKIVGHDWDKIREQVSIDLPEQPFDLDHIILVACSDAYDFTPLKSEDVYITDDSTYLKYFTQPYICYNELNNGSLKCSIVKELWKNKAPDPKEFTEYLTHPETVAMYIENLKKEYVPVTRFNKDEFIIAFEEFHLVKDPVLELTKSLHPSADAN